MSNEIILPAVRFPILSTDRYLNAQQAAKDAVKKRIEEPKQDDFKTSTVSHYPAWFTSSVLAGLAIVLIASFLISGGKQAAAAGLVFDHLSGKFNHLSQLWSDMSIIAMLILSEVGAILFLVSSGTVAHSAPTTKIRGKDVNITQWTLRTFAFLCAAYAIVANVTITALDPLDSVATGLQWMTGVGMPITVLGLGVLLERIIIDALRTSADRQRRYAQAMLEYRAVIAKPEQHEYYPAVLADVLYGEITRYKADREKLGELYQLADTDSQYRLWLVQAEYAAHQQQSNSLIADGANPFLAALPAQTVQP